MQDKRIHQKMKKKKNRERERVFSKEYNFYFIRDDNNLVCAFNWSPFKFTNYDCCLLNYHRSCFFLLSTMTKVINSVPYRPVRPEYTVPASNPVHLTLLFRTGKNTGRTALVPAVPTNFGQYRPVRPVPVGTKKSFFFFFKVL